MHHFSFSLVLQCLSWILALMSFLANRQGDIAFPWEGSIINWHSSCHEERVEHCLYQRITIRGCIVTPQSQPRERRGKSTAQHQTLMYKPQFPNVPGGDITTAGSYFSIMEVRIGESQCRHM